MRPSVRSRILAASAALALMGTPLCALADEAALGTVPPVEPDASLSAVASAGAAPDDATTDVQPVDALGGAAAFFDDAVEGVDEVDCGDLSGGDGQADCPDPDAAVDSNEAGPESAERAEGKEAEEDVAGPVIDGPLSVSAKRATAGDTLTFTIGASDSAGLRGGEISLVNLDTGDFVSVSSWDTSENGLTFSFEVEDMYPSGCWVVEYIMLDDTLGNYAIYYDSRFASPEEQPAVDLSALDFEVYGTTGDLEPPVLSTEGMSVSPERATAGDRVTFTLQMSDDGGKAKAGFLLLANLDTGESASGVAYTWNVSEDGMTVEAHIDIDDMLTSGHWVVKYIELSDLQWNSTVYYDSRFASPEEQPAVDLSALDFEVYGTTGDLEPPVLSTEGMSVSPERATAGDRVTFTFRASDNASGVNIALLSLVNLDTGERKWAAANSWDISEDGTVEAPFDVVETYGLGRWAVESIELGDRHGNWDTYYDSRFAPADGQPVVDLSALDFEIVAEDGGSDDPVVPEQPGEPTDPGQPGDLPSGPDAPSAPQESGQQGAGIPKTGDGTPSPEPFAAIGAGFIVAAFAATHTRRMLRRQG